MIIRGLVHIDASIKVLNFHQLWRNGAFLKGVIPKKVMIDVFR
jgi:hypothetical protein